MVCSTIVSGALEAGVGERLFRFKEGLVSRHSAERSEKLNQANLAEHRTLAGRGAETDATRDGESPP